MIEFEIVARGLYRPDQLIVTYDLAQRMPKTAEMQAWMDDLWQQKLVLAREQGRRLFDAPLFRFVAATAQSDGRLHLCIGNTSYKEYVTSRTPDFAQKHPRQELGNPLAVCSVVETDDNYILLDKRQGVDVYVGRYHVIGGFFERDLDILQYPETDRKNEKKPDRQSPFITLPDAPDSTRRNTNRSRGFAIGTQPDPFAAICREIREETGVQTADISEQYCLGVVYDLETPHGEMCFLTRLNISLDEVMHNRTPEEDEIKQLLSLQVTQESLREFIVNNHGNISATGEPNLLMYGGWKFGEKWFDETMGAIF